MFQNQFNYSDYIVYVDESGDHGLVSINPRYPVFVLAFCIFHKHYYCTDVVPALHTLKFEYFGHDSVVLRSHDIRKQRGDFISLYNRSLHYAFLDTLTATIARIPFTLIATVIDKESLSLHYDSVSNPYAIALQFCLERLYFFLKAQQQHQKTTHIVIEKRGSNEDQDLEQVFQSIVRGKNGHRKQLPFEAIFADKKHNSAGLQLADLVAYPIGRHYIKPEQSNQAYEIVKRKFHCRDNGDFRGYGLKTFPEKRKGSEYSEPLSRLGTPDPVKTLA